MEKEKFAEIIDKGECCSTLNDDPNFKWPEIRLKNLACRNEWNRQNFYPSNGLVAEIYCKLDSWGYILLINDKFYVPMTKRGVKIISEVDYDQKKANNKIKAMDQRQRNINNGLDNFNSSINNDSKDDFSINQLKQLNLKTVFQNDLVNKVDKASNGFTRPIMVDQLGHIVENYAYEMCKEFKDKSGFITPAIRDFICGEVFDTIENLSPEFVIVRHDIEIRLKSRI
jgi:hypothetical protein